MKRYKKSYYDEGIREIEDEEYDALEEELRELSPNSLILKQVGAKAGDLIHSRKMLSLDKSYTIEEVFAWNKDNKATVATQKIDGSSCSLIYKMGKLTIAKTRGDGNSGESIFEQACAIPSIPKKINSNLPEVEVRGEIHCTEKNFFKLSQEMEKLGLEKPKSQRNIVAGILLRKEHRQLAQYLNFLAFDLFPENVDTEAAKMKELERLKFNTPPWKLVTSQKELTNFIQETADFLTNGSYLIDGAVFIINDLAEQKKMGNTTHHPRFKMAYKFAGEIKSTRIESISWQISRFGVLTPVAILEPVDLAGASISKVTLHNYKTVEQFNLKSGDKIKIIRSGEVIPKFLAVDESSLTHKKFSAPINCPFCENKLISDEVRLTCNNSSCPGRLAESIIQFTNKIGIDDLSEKRILQMIELKLIKAIPDLYKVTLNDLLKVPLTKEKMAQKLFNNIQSSKNQDSIGIFFDALGFKGGAKNKVKLLEEAGIQSLEQIFTLTKENFPEIKGFADKTKEDFIRSIKENKKLIKDLLNLGFTFKTKTKPVKQSSKLNGLSFCITGTVSISRKDLELILEENGGVIKKGISKELNFLISNEESTSSKSVKAQELGVTIISESMLKQRFGLTY